MDEEQNPTQMQTETSATAYNRLKRLQSYTRSNIPAVMAHRGTSTFSLHQEPLPVEANDQVLVTVYPQDPFVGQPEVRTMSVDDIHTGMINSRVRVDAPLNQLAMPDEDGNYLFWPGDPRFDQVNVFYFTTFTLRMYERYARRALPWAFPSPRIVVNPKVGHHANAFYSEQDRTVGFHVFSLNGRYFSTAHSADIISHEAAHAVLDGLRDMYNESFGLGPSAFHESFADITAMLVALHDDSLVRRLLDWTKGDIKTNNFVTQLAEHLTNALQTVDDLRLKAHNIYLRNAINDFRDVVFDKLIYEPTDPELTLGRQAHNYSRLFTAAFYDIFAGIYDDLRDGTPKHIAIYRARDIAGALLTFTIEIGPVGEFSFADMARCMLGAERILYNGRYRAILLRVFDERAILRRAEGEAHLKAVADLPRLELPESINSALAAALFLEAAVLPALKIDPTEEFVPLSAYRNARGYAFLTYFLAKRLNLNGEQFGAYHNANVDIFGGLTLVFDVQGLLCHALYRPVTPEDERQIRVMIADLIAHNLVTEEVTPAVNGTRSFLPEGLVLDSTTLNRPDGRQLIKYPVMYDEYPVSETHLKTYYQRVRGQLYNRLSKLF